MTPDLLNLALLKDIALGAEWIGKKRADSRENELKTDYEGGEIIFRQGDSGSEIVILEEGMIEVTVAPYKDFYSLGFDRAFKVIADVSGKKGAIYGELSMFCDIPRSATLTAVGPTRIRIIPKAALLNSLQENPALGVSLAVTLANKLHSTNHKIVNQLIDEFRMARRRCFEFAERLSGLTTDTFAAFSLSKKRNVFKLYELMDRSPLKKCYRALADNQPHEERNDTGRIAEESILADQRLSAQIAIGEYLFRAGPACHRDFYILTSGVAGIFFRDEQIAKIGPGSVIGEAAALSTCPAPFRTADIKALTAIGVVRIPHDRVREYLSNDPAFTVDLCGVIARRVLISNTMLTNATTRIEQILKYLELYRREFAKINEAFRTFGLADDIPLIGERIAAALAELAAARAEFIRNHDEVCKEGVAEYAAELLARLSPANKSYLDQQMNRARRLSLKLGYKSVEDFIRSREKSLLEKLDSLNRMPEKPAPAIAALERDLADIQSGLRFFSSV